jgi:transcriptional regulator with XRE-family HTH domain
MQFGDKVRQLRLAKKLTLRELAAKLEVNFTYLSKIENQKLSFGEYPSEDLILRIAKVLGADNDELLILAEKIPNQIKRRVMARPDAFRKIAELDDRALDKLLKTLDAK